MKSKKQIIFEALKVANCPVAYSDTVHETFPRINFSLIDNQSLRLSDKRHNQRVVYQVDYFSQRALDVETNEVLLSIIESLEANKLLTSDWREVVNIDVQRHLGIYHYFIEVQ